MDQYTPQPSTGDRMAIHPLCLLMPSMDEEEYAAFFEDIRTNGLREDILVWNNQIIDGKERYRACLEAGIEPHFRTLEGDYDVLDEVVARNLLRRHLNKSQRAMVATRYLPYYEQQAQARRRATLAQYTDSAENAATDTGERGRAADHVARIATVSTRYIYYAVRLMDEAPDLAADVSEGVMTIPAALARMEGTQHAIARHGGPHAVGKPKKWPKKKKDDSAEDEEKPKKLHSLDEPEINLLAALSRLGEYMAVDGSVAPEDIAQQLLAQWPDQSMWINIQVLKTFVLEIDRYYKEGRGTIIDVTRLPKPHNKGQSS